MSLAFGMRENLMHNLDDFLFIFCHLALLTKLVSLEVRHDFAFSSKCTTNARAETFATHFPLYLP